MKRIFTPLVMMLLAFTFSLQSYAQKYAERVGDPVATIEEGVDYLLANPWDANYQHLCGDKAVRGNAPLEAIYNFEATGELDKDGNTLYRLKQKTNGQYLEDPALSKNVIRTTADAARAFIFTAKLGKPVDSAADLDGDGQEETTQEWKDADVREKYEPTDQTFENVFVFCNKNLDAETLVLEIFSGNYGVFWTPQYTNARIWHVYKAEPAKPYDELCYYFGDNFPEEGISEMFVVGTAPGNVPEQYFNELSKAYEAAKALVNGDGKENEQVYNEAKENLAKALKACKDNFIQVTAGYYVIDNNPAGGRPTYANTKNACLTDINGNMYWRGFDKPEVMTVEGAAFIWQVIPAEGKDGGFYLRNYGTNRYAGTQKNNYQIVPSSAEPKQVYDFNFRGGEYFSLDMRNGNETYPALHADQNTDMKIVIWSSVASASQWKFIPVNASELEGIENELEQRRLNTELLGHYNKAVNAWNKGFAYTAESCTRDGVFTMDNTLITDKAQLLSNAPESPDKEPGNDYGNLIDGNFESYFHTVWSNNEYAKNFHYLDIALNEAVKTFNIKYASRHNNTDGCPTRIHVFASNDTTGGAWTDEGYMTCEYPYSVEWQNNEGETVKKNNFAGVASKDMSEAYKYVRLQVEGTRGNRKTNGNLFWYWSELRMYKAAYDKNISLIEAVPTDIKEAFLEVLKKAKAEIDAKKATPETIEAIQAEYNKFMENFPDPDILTNLIKEAEAQANNAEVDDVLLGYFKSGAPEALKEALEKAKLEIKQLMTMAEINAVKDKINAALAEFNSKLNVPEDGMYLYIQSATSETAEGTAADQFLCAINNDAGQVKYGQPEAMNDRINYLWKTIKFEDGSYAFQNVGTGNYVGNPKQNNVKVTMSFDPDSLNLRSAKAAGLFNIICKDNVFYNAQPGTGNLVTWGNASGTDNSAFRFIPLAEAGDFAWDANTIHIDFSNKHAKVASYPYDLVGDAYNCSLYKVLGLNEGVLQLQLYTTEETIPAATPFIVIPNAPAEGEAATTEGGLYLANGFDEAAGMTYVMTGKNQNGLQATITSVENIRGGILFESNVINAVEGDKSYANSGFFNGIPEKTTATGDVQMSFPTDLETGIENIVIVPNNSAVYSISGVKVRNNANLNNLPKGVYIVNGKKVLVK